MDIYRGVWVCAKTEVRKKRVRISVMSFRKGIAITDSIKGELQQQKIAFCRVLQLRQKVEACLYKCRV